MRTGMLVAAGLVAALLAWRWRRLGTEVRIVGLTLVAGLAVYGSGQIELPNVEETIRDVGKTLGTWTYLLVAVLAFLETGAFVGLVAPGEFTIIFGGVVAGQGEISVLALIGIVWASAVAGDTVSFFLGRRLGRGFMLRHGPKVQITPERLATVERFFARHGGKTILIGRFVGVVRAVAPFIAGASRMPFSRFLPYDIIGAGLWGTTFVVLGYAFWQSFDRVASIAGRGAFALGVVISLVVAAIVAYRQLREPEKRAATKAWLKEQAERPALRPLARVGRPVYRRAVRPAWRRVAIPLRFFWNRVTPGQLGLELTTLTAVAAVGTFSVITLASLVPGSRLPEIDGDALDLVDDMRTSLLTDVAEIVSAVGSTPAVIALLLMTVGYLAGRRRVAEASAIAVAYAVTWPALQLVESLEDRARPPAPLVDVEGASFPSTHAANSIALVAVAVALRHGIPNFAGRAAIQAVALVLAAAIGLSRVYLHAHWFSDVLAGWGLAAAIFALCGMVALVISFLRENASPS